MASTGKTTRALAILLVAIAAVSPLIMATYAGGGFINGEILVQEPEAARSMPGPSPVQQEWVFSTPGEGAIYSSPALADVDGDGKIEVLIGSEEYRAPWSGFIYCLNGSENPKWVYNSSSPIWSSPAIGDVDEDGKPEIIAGTYFSPADGDVVSINGTGYSKWVWSDEGSSQSSASIGDLDGDGKAEVLIGWSDSSLKCFNGSPSEPVGPRWSFLGYNSFYSSPAVADLDNDGKLEVVVGSEDNNVYCLNSSGIQQWSYLTGGYVDSSPAIADVDGDGHLEVIVGSTDGNVTCLSGSGAFKWNFTTGGSVYSCPVVVDIDDDGKQEVIFGSDDYYIYCLNSSGKLEWRYQTYSWVWSSPAVADVDGDGKLEVVVGSQDSYLYCLNGTGGFEWSFYAPSSIQSSPSVADIDGDNQLEIVVGSDTNQVYCIGVKPENYSSNGYPWPSIGFRSDIRHTGWYVDSDGDGLTDNYELIVGTDPHSTDTDTDGFTDYQEFVRSTNPFLDQTPPAPITNLATSNPTGTTITLTWTAPGDNGVSGSAAGYIVKYSTAGSIDETNWTLAATYTQSPSWIPLVGGSTETHVISDLNSETKYWFAVKAYDEVPNYGVCSNSPSATTIDITVPAAICDLAVSNPTQTSITLTWTAPGDNGTLGTAAGYIVKYSTSGPITETNWPSEASYTQSWTPQPAGSTETHAISGLSNGTQYWFAIKAYDERPNYGGISNSPMGMTFVAGWNSSEPVNLIPGPGNNATMPAGAFQQYGFTMVTTNATDVVVTTATIQPPGTSEAPSGSESFLYLDIKGNQVSGTTGVAIYVIYNRTLAQSLGLDEFSMQIHRWNATISQWIAVPSTVTLVNSTHGVITAHLDHLSYFAVFGTSAGTSGSPVTLLTIGGAAGAAIVVVVAIVVVKKRSAVVTTRKKTVVRKRKR